MTEFDLIRRYFTRAAPNALLGIGDDAALLQVSADVVLAVSTDMLVSGIHFLPDADPNMLGHKTLAVNLSDMAAMGATPRWAILAISLPDADEAWLERFSAGFFSLAQQNGVELVGGDTTRGPLNLCVTVFGEIPAQQALRRSGAQIDDEIWVSGTLGDAALALAHLKNHVVLTADELAACAPALHQPQPRVALGVALRGIANSAIDISDGLLGDLGHILDASQVAAEIDFPLLPISNVLRARTTPISPPLSGGKPDSSPDKGMSGGVELFRQCILSGGDDYELCFTAPIMHHAKILSTSARLTLPLTCIGKIVAGSGCVVHDASGNLFDVGAGSYDHFR